MQLAAQTVYKQRASAKQSGNHKQHTKAIAIGCWAAWYSTRLLVETAPKGTVFPFCFLFSQWVQGTQRQQKAYQQSQRGNLEQQPELGLCGWGGHIGEHSLLFHNDLQQATMLCQNKSVRVAHCLCHSVPACALDIPGAV